MQNRRQAAIIAICAVLAIAAPSWSADIRVSPITLDFSAGRHAGVLIVTNTGERAQSVQLRVVKWTEVNGDDRLTPTDDVVASPPMALLPAKGNQLVRIVRVRSGPTEAEEAYRVLVDEIPDLVDERPGEVLLVVRQSLPVFFNDRPATKPDLSWGVEAGGGGVRLVAHNAGGRRLRISALTLHDRSGAVLYELPGLAGYVLAGSSLAWALPAGDGARAGAVTAQTDLGAIHAELAPAS